MPSGLRRYQSTGQHHFITFSCHDRQPYLQSDPSKEHFLKTLESTRILYEFQVAAYVVMPEHVHLLLTEPPAKSLSTALAVLKRTVSKRHLQNPYWLPRYYDFNVSSNEKLFEKLKYIHRNPVQRGLVEHPEEYPWSSFRAYGLHEPGPVTITRAV